MNSTNELTPSYSSGSSRWDETELLGPNPLELICEPRGNLFKHWNLLEETQILKLIGGNTNYKISYRYRHCLYQTQILEFLFEERNCIFWTFSGVCPILQHTLLNFPPFSERRNNNQYLFWVKITKYTRSWYECIYDLETFD